MNLSKIKYNFLIINTFQVYKSDFWRTENFLIKKIAKFLIKKIDIDYQWITILNSFLQ